jgi:hypothetical protein
MAKKVSIFYGSLLCLQEPISRALYCELYPEPEKSAPCSRTLSQGCTNFRKIWEPSQNSRDQKGNMKQVPHCGPICICRHGNQALGICAPIPYLF